MKSWISLRSNRLGIQKSNRMKCLVSLNLLGSLWLLFTGLSLAGFTASTIFAQGLSPCVGESPGDFVVGRTRSEVVTVRGNRAFPTRIIVRNRSTLHFLSANVEINGDVLVCDSSRLKVERSVVSVKMQYFSERVFKADNGSTFEFTRSFFTNENRFVTSIELKNSSLTMNSMNRVDLERRDLGEVIAGWTTSLDDSSATIADTTFIGEVSTINGRSSFRFIRSQGLILWINFFEPNSGGTITPPSTEERDISWRLDGTTAGVHGIEYSIQIENSRLITSGVLVWVYNGVPNADLTIRDGSAAIGLLFVNQPDVKINNFREGLYSEFSPALPNRRLRLERVRVWSWNVYGLGSEIAITDSDIGEIFVESFVEKTARVQVSRSKLTGNGGYYRANNSSNVSPPPTLAINESEVHGEVISLSGGLVILESSRVFGPGSGVRGGAELVADKGTIVVLNSILSSPTKAVTKQGGAIWQASIEASVQIREDGTRLVTFRGDAAILSEERIFSRYTIAYSPESNPSESHLIHLSTTPVLKETLFSWRIPETLPAGNYIAVVTVYDASGNAHRVSKVIHIPSTGGSIRYSIQASGVESLKTVGTGSQLRVGSIVVNPSPQDATPGGTAIFSFTHNGVLVTEAAVPDSPLTTRARIFVDSSDRTSTGVAIANPSREEARVSLTLTSVDGARVLGTTGLIIPPYGQIPRFVSEFIPGLPINFQGNLSIESDHPVATVTLKRAVNERGELIFTTLPVADVNDPPSIQPFIIPHIADGGGIKTEVVLINKTSQTLTGRVHFFSSEGRALYLTIGDRTNNEFPYTIAPRGVLSLRTSGGERLQAGYAWVEPASGQMAPQGSAMFSFVQDGVFVWEAGYSSMPSTARSRLFVEFTQRTNTGIAMANPNDRAALVTLSLISKEGREVARTAVEIPARGHLSRFLNEMIDMLPNTFRGALDIASSEPLSVVALRSGVNERGVFLVTTLPVVDLTVPPRSQPLVFPHMVDGVGFHTQIILINPTISTISGSVSFFGPNGNPQPTEAVSLSEVTQ